MLLTNWTDFINEGGEGKPSATQKHWPARYPVLSQTPFGPVNLAEVLDQVKPARPEQIRFRIAIAALDDVQGRKAVARNRSASETF
jgi:hypothetical protein